MESLPLSDLADMDADFGLNDEDFEMLGAEVADDQLNNLLNQEVLQHQILRDLGLFGTPGDAIGAGSAPGAVQAAPPAGGGFGGDPGASAAQQVAQLLAGTHPSLRGVNPAEMAEWLAADEPVITLPGGTADTAPSQPQAPLPAHPMPAPLMPVLPAVAGMPPPPPPQQPAQQLQAGMPPPLPRSGAPLPLQVQLELRQMLEAQQAAAQQALQVSQQVAMHLSSYPAQNAFFLPGTMMPAAAHTGAPRPVVLPVTQPASASRGWQQVQQHQQALPAPLYQQSQQAQQALPAPLYQQAQQALPAPLYQQAQQAQQAAPMQVQRVEPPAGEGTPGELLSLLMSEVPPAAPAPSASVAGPQASPAVLPPQAPGDQAPHLLAQQAQQAQQPTLTTAATDECGVDVAEQESPASAPSEAPEISSQATAHRTGGTSNRVYGNRQSKKIEAIESQLAKLQREMALIKLENERLKAKNQEVEAQLQLQRTEEQLQQLAAAVASTSAASMAAAQQQMLAAQAGLQAPQLAMAASLSPPNSQKKLLMQLSNSMRPADQEMLKVAALSWPRLRDWYCQLMSRFREVLAGAASQPQADAEKAAKEALRGGRYWDLLVFISRPDLSARLLNDDLSVLPTAPAAPASASSAAPAPAHWAAAALAAMELSDAQRASLAQAWQRHREAAGQRAARKQQLLAQIRSGFLQPLQQARPEELELGKPLARQGLEAMEALRLVVRQDHVSAVQLACTLRKLLSPLQQARLAAAAWPFYPDPNKWAPLLTEEEGEQQQQAQA